MKTERSENVTGNLKVTDPFPVLSGTAFRHISSDMQISVTCFANKWKDEIPSAMHGRFPPYCYASINVCDWVADEGTDTIQVVRRE